MNILILGATGFLGRYVTEELMTKQLKFTVLTRTPEKLQCFSRRPTFIVGDLLNFQDLDLTPFTHFINCSGEVSNEKMMHSIHVEAVSGLLNKVKEIPNAHWIQISSVGVYGRVRKGIVTENSSFDPIGTYEKTKAQGELIVKDFCLKNHIFYTIIRPSIVFGRTMSNQSLAQLIFAIKRKFFFYIGLNKNEISMNYIAVEDVASFIIHCLENPNTLNQDFNISDQLSLSEFIKTICTELKINDSFYSLPNYFVRLIAFFSRWIPGVPISSSRVDALTTRTVYSSKKAENIGFITHLGVTTGLQNYINTLISKK